MTDVVHVYKDFPPVFGGIENHIQTLTRALTERGLEVGVLCSRTGGLPAVEISAGVRIMRCAAPLTIASTPLPPTLPLALRSHPARIVHLHYPWPPAELAWLLGGRGRPLVVTVHCEVVRYPRLAGLLEPLTRRVLAAARFIIVTSETMAAVPLLSQYSEKLRVISCGVDLGLFRPRGDGSDPLPAVPHPRIVFVGRLRHYKGLPVLAEALAMLPGVHLIVIGEGPERGSFEATLQRLGCRQRAHLLGQVSAERLVAVLQHADAAVLPSTSRAEAFGVAIVEAQACGLPAVVTDVGTGTVQTISDGRSGRVVRPGDPAALAEALRWCLDSEGDRERRGAARQHAESHYGAARMAAEIQQLYEAL